MAEGHIIGLRVDVGAHGNELVDKVEMAQRRHKVEGAPAELRWKGREAAEGGVQSGRSKCLVPTKWRTELCLDAGMGV